MKGVAEGEETGGKRGKEEVDREGTEDSRNRRLKHSPSELFDSLDLSMS